MKKLLLTTLAVLLVAMPAAAQFQQMVEIQVKPGHEVAFEAFMKKVIEANDKTGSSTNWSTFSVALGKTGSTYRVGLPFAKWGDRDAWIGLRQALVQAFGEQEGTKIFSEGNSNIASSSSRVWEMLEDMTANPQTDGGSAPFYEVTVRYVKPEMVAEYRGLLRRFKSAYENDARKPNVTRWILRFGEGQGTTFRRTQPFDSWGERDGWNAVEAITKQFGPDAPLLFERMSSAVWKTEHFVSAYRPDLSRAPASSTSND